MPMAVRAMDSVGTCSFIQTCSSTPSPKFLHSSTQLAHHLSFPTKMPNFFRKMINHRQLYKPMLKQVPTLEVDNGHESLEATIEKGLEIQLTALVTVRNNNKMEPLDMMVNWLGGYTTDPGKKGVGLQLVSCDIDPRTKQPYLSDEATLEWSKSFRTRNKQLSTFKVNLKVGSSFGMPGAILVSNKYQNEFYLENIKIEGFVNFACDSWVQPQNLHAHKRIFFTDKAYLPWETPAGLKVVREKELEQLRGDGKGIRKPWDRIYDYDFYNDLGDPDKGPDYVRPIMGGQNIPYPRRCRTGRSPNNTDKKTEIPTKISKPIYVPRDEVFEDPKEESMSSRKWKLAVNNFISIIKKISGGNDSFKEISEIDLLYNKKPTALDVKSQVNNFWMNIAKIPLSMKEYFHFDPPKTMPRDGAFFSLRDDHFGRVALAGMNPLTIERLKVFPPVSKLDPSIYGTCESALKDDHIIAHLGGMSVQQALEEKKLYILDYHDTFLPFLERINGLGDRQAYATRAILLLTPLGTLQPIAIELSLPKSKQVFTPPTDATTYWLWQLAKAHVCSNDAGAHQLIHHWLRAHACVEPFIIATHRQLSKMHPVHKLLGPHMRYTIQINAEARKDLVSEGGIIESFFASARYSLELSASAYQNWWRFDLEGLPADLIRRGMAEPDPTQASGIKLTIEDYPYASDGLLIWSATERLVRTYVKHYYNDSSRVSSDVELQCWYKEIINVGHGDLRNATWWPRLSTPDDLTAILTTIIWITSAQHAATNFGQYSFGAYIPIRPPMIRKPIPNSEHDHQEYENFLKDPEMYFLSALPSLSHVTYMMSVLDLLSTHSPDEEYLGDRKELSAWSGEPEIIEAFYQFSLELKRIEKEIQERNVNPMFRNRCGAGVPPYELLMPSSGPGITCRGVPNSITI